MTALTGNARSSDTWPVLYGAKQRDNLPARPQPCALQSSLLGWQCSDGRVTWPLQRSECTVWHLSVFPANVQWISRIDSNACADIIPSLPLVSRFRNTSWEHSTENDHYWNYLIQSCTRCANTSCVLSGAETALSSPAVSPQRPCPSPIIAWEGWGSLPHLPHLWVVPSLYLRHSEADRTQTVVPAGRPVSSSPWKVRVCGSQTVSQGCNSKPPQSRTDWRQTGRGSSAVQLLTIGFLLRHSPPRGSLHAH